MFPATLILREVVKSTFAHSTLLGDLRSEDEVGIEIFAFEEVEEPPLTRRQAISRALAERRAEEARDALLRRKLAREQLLSVAVDAPVPPVSMSRFSSVYETPFVYFAQLERGGPVKIGSARDFALRRRLCNLQIGNSEVLVVRRLVFGGTQLERLLHLEFADLRVRGEWFRDEGDVADWIRPDGVLRVLLRGG